MSTILEVLTAFLFLRWKNNAQLINLRTITITLCIVKAFIREDRRQERGSINRNFNSGYKTQFKKSTGTRFKCSNIQSLHSLSRTFLSVGSSWLVVPAS